MYEAVFAPGDAYLKHRLAREEMYYIKSGRSLAGVGDKRAEVGAGDYHLVLAGVEHWLVNTVTAIIFGVLALPRASTAAAIMAAPPEAWIVSIKQPSSVAARTAPATVFGMS